MQWRIKRFVFAVLLLIDASVPAENLTVLAAASTTESMTEIGALFTKQTGHTVQFGFGSAGALARQIQNGAPADLFLSANEQWMDALGDRVESRVDLLKNRLVLIAPKGRSVTLDANFSGRLAVGNMESVPAGMYARQVLAKLSILETMKPNLVSCDSVRNVLFFVERGEADAGMVYATDAKISDRVTVVSVFPEDLHDSICYPVAMCRTSTQPDAAREFLVFLQSPAAGEVFERYGFVVGQGCRSFCRCPAKTGTLFESLYPESLCLPLNQENTRSRIRDSTNGREALMRQSNDRREWQPRPTMTRDGE